MHRTLFFAHRFIELLLEKRIEIQQVVLDKSFLPYLDLKLVLADVRDENRVLRLEHKYNGEIEKDNVRINIHFVRPEQIEDGILLWGKPVQVTAANKELKEKRVVTYDTTQLPQIKRAELVRRLFGYKTKKNEKVYEFESLLKKVDGKRLRNAIVVDDKDAESITAILKEYDIPFKCGHIFTKHDTEFIEK